MKAVPSQPFYALCATNTSSGPLCGAMRALAAADAEKVGRDCASHVFTGQLAGIRLARAGGGAILLSNAASV